MCRVGTGLIFGCVLSVCAPGGVVSAQAECPVPEEERAALGNPVLRPGERPWALSPLPTKPPPAPTIQLPAAGSDGRRHLVRRLTFVLSGLPAREDDAAAFLADSSPQALDKIIDRLLAAATAAQRLAEVWLRATSYVDRWTSPDVPDNLQPVDSWKYRDWAVSTLRSTRDVRTLARLTLAGDSQAAKASPPAARRALTATQWHLLAAPPAGDYMNTVVEWTGRQAERSALAFLGLDLTCSRCHDHPAVPLTSEEAAGLVAIFAHTQAFAPSSGGVADWFRISTGTEATRKKTAQIMKAVGDEEARIAEKRHSFALLAATEFLPQTAEYVRAAWAWHQNPRDSLAAFAAARGLLEEPLKKWIATLGLAGDPPAHAVNAAWWATWSAARKTATQEAIATASRAIQETHQIDAQSPFFSTSPALDAFFTLDQQTQIARMTAQVAELRRSLPEADRMPGIAEGHPAGLEPPVLLPSLPGLLTGNTAATPIAPPGAGRRALASWLEGEGTRFFARLTALRLAQGLGAPLTSGPVTLTLWSREPPPEAADIDGVAAALLTGGWPAAAKRILLLQLAAPVRPPLAMGGSEWRDALLFAAGTLDPRQGGPPDSAPDSTRRSLYREWAPVPSAATLEFLEVQATALAALARRKAGADPLVQLTWLVHHLFHRPPTSDERAALQSDPTALVDFCAHLLQSEEFRTLP